MQYPEPQKLGGGHFATTFNGLTICYHVIRRHNGHTKIVGRINGEIRLECDVTTTARFHPDRFWREVHESAYQRLIQITQAAA